jgi:ectoine hydroxylase-related dioxygenase (phytanoyl-CoA dioxygenase family)
MTRKRSPSRVDGWIPQLRDLGFVLATGILEADELRKLHEAFPTVAAGSTTHVEIDDSTPHVDRWHRLTSHPEINELLDRLLGPGRAVTVHGRAPGRGAGAQGLHADRPPGRRHEPEALTLLWMLDDFDADNGATRVVPGSHRIAAPPPRPYAQPDRTHPDEKIVVGRAGSVLILDSHLWHSGRRNESGALRRAVQMLVSRGTAAPAEPSQAVEAVSSEAARGAPCRPGTPSAR